MTSAVVVGSGPNGLAAAVTLAVAGVDVTVLEAAETIGGGTRSAELTLPGLIHDVCSAAHPTGVASPFFRSLDLAGHGLEWLWPEVDAAHPLDDGSAGVLWRDLERTATHLGTDGDRWRRTYGPLTARADELVGELFQPLVHVPRHPFLLARFGLPGLLPAERFVNRWDTPQARALYSGLAAHAISPFRQLSTGAMGLMFGTMGHAYGWPVARGGSQSIADALGSILTAKGGVIRTGERVTTLPDADLVFFDTSPDQVLSIGGDRLAGRVTRSLRRWKHGPGVYKLDLAVEGGIPWVNEHTRLAGTVHVGGTFEEVAAAEATVAAGRMPERPFVLVCQQYLADPSRSVGETHPIWAYAHVPNGFTGDATDAILSQIERFAPGFRDRIVATSIRTPADLQADNANYVGGDIAGGAATLRQTVFRPRPGLDPYWLGDGLYLCSASAPPGGGVHGMAGHLAATSALKRL